MEEKLREERIRKLNAYRVEADPYPAETHRSLLIAEVIKHFPALKRAKKSVTLTGRIFSVRDQGKIIFLDCRDETGALQVVLHQSKVKNFELIKKTLDQGDFMEARGMIDATARGEKSLFAREFRIITKSIRPIPSAWYGIEDTENLLRRRYLDILFHNDVREMFMKKAIFWDLVRTFLKRERFLEVEMPILESVPGGAEAEPFVTHHNALDRDFYLRISLELPLKKMLVGGYEKVFEIGRIFRNEGIDREHLQDYTQMECYWAYADYEDMMKLMEKLYKLLAKAVTGSLKTTYNGMTIDWGKKWKKVDYIIIFKKETGIDLKTATEEILLAKAREMKLEAPKGTRKGRLIDLIYKKAVRPKLVEPCFLIDPPVEIEPLAKRLSKDSSRVARFQILAGGTELGKGFSELNDPLDQRARFEEQMRLREAGDKEAQRLDESFLEALEYGMPPAAGFGMSERVFAILMNKPIRETVIFPLMREEG